MSREIDALIAEKVMGWKVFGKSAALDGGFWDASASRTRMIANSGLHESRQNLGIEDDPRDEFLGNYPMTTGKR